MFVCEREGEIGETGKGKYGVAKERKVWGKLDSENINK